MTGDAMIAAVSGTGETGSSPGQWPVDAWGEAIGWCDTLLRRLYRIQEFTDDPDCVFRVGLRPARDTILLSDGTRIEAGETIGSLHFWNEQLPRRAECGPGLGWASEMRRHVVHSLEALALYIEADWTWRGIRAFHAESALSARLGQRQVARLVHRYGFEISLADRSLLQRLHDLGDDFLLWGLARAYNSAALPRLRFFREHRDLWISRPSLLRLYLPDRQPRRVRPSGHGAA
jgi:hypothetical protein